MATSLLVKSLRRIFGPSCRLRLSQRLVHHDVDVEGVGFESTSLDILNKNTDALYINSYSQLGFRLNNGMSIVGPCVLFPRTVLQWNVGGIEDINEKSLSLFYMLEPKLDLLVLGIGDQGNRLSDKILHSLRMRKINLEVLPTDQACSTFNFLNSEGRYVAGAFVPPSYVANEFSDEVIMVPGTDPYKALTDFSHVDDSEPELPVAEEVDRLKERQTEQLRAESKTDDKEPKYPKPDM